MVKVATSAHMDVGAEPGKVIAGLNSTLCRQAQGQYATAVYVFLDQATRMGCYCAAGHPPLLLWHRATRTLLELNERGLLLGVRPSEEYAQTEFTFEAGDRLLIYTDGLVEAVNARGEAFGETQLGEFIATRRIFRLSSLLSDCLIRRWVARERERPRAGRRHHCSGDRYRHHARTNSLMHAYHLGA